MRLHIYMTQSYLKATNVKTVRAMATRETDTPTLPMTSNDNTTASVRLKGDALSKMAKCVRWLHSHTVTEVLERLSDLLHPLSDHCPALRMLLSVLDSIKKSRNTHSISEVLSLTNRS